MKAILPARAIACEGSLEDYAAVAQAAEHLFQLAATLWPEAHDAYLRAESAARKGHARMPSEDWKPKPGSIDESVLRCWREEIRDPDTIAVWIGKQRNSVSLSLARLRSAGLLDEAVP